MNRFLLFLISVVFSSYSCTKDRQSEVVNKYPDGTTQKIYYIEWNKNTKNIVGEVRFFPNGEKEIEGDLNNWKREGKWTYWYNNNQIHLIENYKNGVKDGEVIEYYKSGEINYTGYFTKGLPDKEWDFYDGNGNVTNSINYKNGLPEK